MAHRGPLPRSRSGRGERTDSWCQSCLTGAFPSTRGSSTEGLVSSPAHGRFPCYSGGSFQKALPLPEASKGCLEESKMCFAGETGGGVGRGSVQPESLSSGKAGGAGRSPRPSVSFAKPGQPGAPIQGGRESPLGWPEPCFELGHLPLALAVSDLALCRICLDMVAEHGRVEERGLPWGLPAVGAEVPMLSFSD